MRSTHKLMIALLLFTAVMACYSATLNAGFVWDDHFIVVRNSLLRAPILSFQPFFQDIVNSSFTHTIYYRPVQIMSYAIDYRLWGMNPAGYHFMNAFLHFVNSLLVLALAYRVTRSKGTSALTALLFAVHPVHAGAVSYVSGRTDLLFFMFGISFMLVNDVYRRTRDVKMLAAGGVFLLLSLASKEAALIFPVLMLLADVTVLEGDRRTKVTAGVVNFGIAGLYALGHYFVLGSRYPFTVGAMGASGFIQVLRNLGRFLFMEVIPSGVFLRRADGSMPEVLVSAFILIPIMLMLTIGLKRVRRFLVFAIYFMVLAIVPFLFAGQLTGLVSEHWAYLSSFGAVLFFSVVVAQTYRSSAGPARTVALSMAYLAVASYSFVTIQQTSYWRDDVSLSERVLELSPGDTTAVNFKLASEMKADVMTGASVDRAFVGRDKDLTCRGYYLKGRRYIVAGETGKAHTEFLKAAEADPFYANAYLGLAMVAFMRNEEEKGMEYLEKARQIDPLHPEVLLLRTKVYAREGDVRAAITAAKEAWARDPYGYDALMDLGEAFLRAGGVREAAERFLEASELYPEKAEPKYKLADIFYFASESGDAEAREEAGKWAKKAIMTDPDYLPAQELILRMKN